MSRGKGFTWILLLVLLCKEGRGAVEGELGKRIARPVDPSAENPSQRIHHVMVSVGSNLFLFGGQTFENIRNDMWRFDGTKWTLLFDSALPTKRFSHMLIALPSMGTKGSIMLVGGKRERADDRGCQHCNNMASKVSTDLWMYDIASNSWRSLGVGPKNITDMDGKWGFACTSEVIPSCKETGSAYLSDHPVYQTGPATVSISLVSVSYYDTQILSFGGWKVIAATESDETWSLELSGTTWRWRQFELKSSPSNPVKPPARYLHDMAWVNSTAIARLESGMGGVVVVFGGFVHGVQKDLGDTWLFFLSQKIWVQATSPSSPCPRYYHSMVSYDSFVYLHGGLSHRQDEQIPHNDLWRFDVANKKWSEMNLPSDTLINRHAFAMTSLSDLIYFHGGKLRDGSDDTPSNFVDNRLWRIDTSLLCDKSSYYRESTRGMGGQCQACSACSDGQYVAYGCTAEKDNLCLPCTVCGTDKFIEQKCSTMADTLCGSCKDVKCGGRGLEVDLCHGDTDTAGVGTVVKGLTVSTNTSMFLENCGFGSKKGCCRSCTACDATKYLVQGCSAQRDTECGLCKHRQDTECTAGLQLVDCGYGKFGRCVPIELAQAPQVEPIWLTVIIVVGIAILLCILCGLALHMRRWLKKKEKEREQREFERQVNNNVDSIDINMQTTSLQDLQQASSLRNFYTNHPGLSNSETDSHMRAADAPADSHTIPQVRPQSARTKRLVSAPLSGCTAVSATPAVDSSSSIELLSLQSRPVSLVTEADSRNRFLQKTCSNSALKMPADLSSSNRNEREEEFEILLEEAVGAVNTERQGGIERVSPPLRPLEVLESTAPPISSIAIHKKLPLKIHEQPFGDEKVCDDLRAHTHMSTVSPSHRQVLDEAAETRKKLARERGRRNAQARQEATITQSVSETAGSGGEGGSGEEHEGQL